MIWFLNKFTVKYVTNIQKNLIKRRQSHYEVLNLARSCTAKQIKDSYIKLSKKYHPDRNTDKDSHAKFVKVVAAYKVLSKPESRLDYDLGLVRDLNELKYDENIATNRNPWSDPSFWHNRKKEHDTYYSNQPYYGIKGIKKVSNLVIVLFCLIITFIGVGLQVYAIRHSVTLKRDDMLMKSNDAQMALMKARERAERNGNLVQLKLLKERMERKHQD